MDRILIGDHCEIVVTDHYPDRLLPARSGRQRAVVIAQPTVRAVAEDVARRIGGLESVDIIEVPDRDAAKTLDVVGGLYTELAQLNLGRHDTVIGVGGGAVTDLAGFIAATWLRGIESVLVPTTLLGAVDASIGGKTGINHAGKNLVGAFWHPTRVVVNLGVLAQLPDPLLREGAAEILKAGFLADREIVHQYERNGLDAPLDIVVPRSIAVKAKVVNEDFREGASRAFLNFGHTIGHGVEVIGGLSHGHAVGVGMVAAGAVSRELHGFDDTRLVTIIQGLGLPIGAPGLARDDVLDLIQRDKKRVAAGLRMVLLEDIEQPVVEVVDDRAIDIGLRSIGIS